MSKVLRKPVPYTMLLGFYVSIFAVLIFLFQKVQFVFPESLIAIFFGIFWVGGVSFYSKALIKEEVSRVMSLFFTLPLVVTILATIFLKEILIPVQYLGIVLLVASGILISYKKSKGKFFIPSIKMILIAILFLSLYDIQRKYVLNVMSYWSLYFWNVVGINITSLFLLFIPTIRRDFIKLVKILKKTRLLYIMLGTETAAFLGDITFNIATSTTYVSLVVAIGPLQPFFVLLFMILISLFKPKILKEEINKKIVAIKLLSLVLLFLGTWLITMKG
jgi:drug/metabolite transporter (DMT)-like permease